MHGEVRIWDNLYKDPMGLLIKTGDDDNTYVKYVFEVESGDKNIGYVCKACGKHETAPITGYIKYDDDNYECEACHRQYKTLNTMKRHLKYECGKKPSIECPILNCGYKAKIRDRMRQHVRMKHKIQI
ncbi:hypothetical protein NQ317_012850 [Molorchus minor]|uniref:C2H2-type domain-containing protein n=1 Tax=Molorchus minor TaxID=1323400 RepID=A0ABQ9JDV0_9CUCU|nr:hypothetical protein NQ317_012850 [Molorchus minor]